MGAPGAEHERRVSVLEELATLAGFTRAWNLSGLRPDVCRSGAGSRIFIGDAKWSELPGCEATADRLKRYLRRSRDEAAVGGEVSVVLCVGSHPLEWTALLVGLSTSILERVIVIDPTALGAGDFVVGIRFQSSTARPLIPLDECHTTSYAAIHGSCA